MKLNLSAPTTVMFIVSLVIAVIGVLAALGIASFIPVASVWIVTIGYAVLAAACLFKGA